jgi:hypothetical protein
MKTKSKFALMKRLSTAIAAILFCLPLFGQIQSNVLTGKISDFSIKPRAGLVVNLSITRPINRTINGIFISNDPIQETPDAGGNFAFTNIQAGIYRFWPQDSSGSYWTVTNYNTTGTWPLASLVTSQISSFSNPGTNVFSQSQSLALFIQQLNAGTNISVVNNNDGTWTISSTGSGGGGSGTITNGTGTNGAVVTVNGGTIVVSAAAPGAVTTGDTRTIVLSNNANMFFGGGYSPSNATPTFNFQYGTAYDLASQQSADFNARQLTYNFQSALDWGATPYLHGTWGADVLNVGTLTNVNNIYGPSAGGASRLSLYATDVILENGSGDYFEASAGGLVAMHSSLGGDVSLENGIFKVTNASIVGGMSGTNIQTGTISTNKVDATFMAALGGSGGSTANVLTTNAGTMQVVSGPVTLTNANNILGGDISKATGSNTNLAVSNFQFPPWLGITNFSVGETIIESNIYRTDLSGFVGIVSGYTPTNRASWYYNPYGSSPSYYTNDGAGNVTMSGTLKAGTVTSTNGFIGNLTGNADSATNLVNGAGVTNVTAHGGLSVESEGATIRIIEVDDPQPHMMLLTNLDSLYDMAFATAGGGFYYYVSGQQALFLSEALMTVYGVLTPGSGIQSPLGNYSMSDSLIDFFEPAFGVDAFKFQPGAAYSLSGTNGNVIDIYGQRISGFSFSGTNIDAGTVGSNKLDTATRAMLGGGSLPSGLVTNNTPGAVNIATNSTLTVSNLVAAHISGDISQATGANTNLIVSHFQFDPSFGMTNYLYGGAMHSDAIDGSFASSWNPYYGLFYYTNEVTHVVRSMDAGFNSYQSGNLTVGGTISGNAGGLTWPNGSAGQVATFRSDGTIAPSNAPAGGSSLYAFAATNLFAGATLTNVQFVGTNFLTYTDANGNHVVTNTAMGQYDIWNPVTFAETNSGPITLTTNLIVGGTLTVGGDINFTVANPFFNSASYPVFPHGIDVGDGGAYFTPPICARAGIYNDQGFPLTLGTYGIATYSSNTLALASISFPATTVNWTNATGKNIFVFIDNAGVTGTALKINGTQISSTLLVTGDTMIPLQPGEYFSETYTIGTPIGVWKPQ